MKSTFTPIHHFLAICLLIILSTNINAQSYIQSDFQSGTGGWTTNSSTTTCAGSTAGISTWVLATSCGGDPLALGSTCFGSPNDGNNGPENSWIISPVFTPLSSYISIDFDSWTSNEPGFPCGYDVELVEITQNGGLTWTLIHGNIPALHDNENDQQWRHIKLSTAITAGVATRIRFRYDTGDDYSGSSSTGWYLDNIEVKPSINFTHTETNPTCSSSTNGSIVFNVLQGTPPYQYSIDNGVTFQSSPSFLSKPTGTYNLVIQDGLAQNTNPIAVTLQANTNITAQVTATTPVICDGESVLINAFTSSGYSYRWRKNNTYISGTNAPASYTATTAGDYSVEVSKNGCTTVSNMVNISALSKPTVSINSMTSACLGIAEGSIEFNTPTIGTPPFLYSLNGGLTFNTSPTIGNLLAGTYSAKVKDAMGCLSNTESITLSPIVDTTAPFLLLKNATVYLDNTGLVQISTNDINLGSTDNCSLPILTVSPSTFSSSNLGNNTVSVLATDASLNSTNGTTTVTVLDTLSPVVSTNNLTVYVDANGSATINIADIDNNSNDNSGQFTLSLSQSAFTCGQLGENSIELSAIDASGNTSSTTAIVTVLDTIKPTLTILPQLTLLLGEDGLSSLSISAINDGSTDNCSISDYTLSQSLFSSIGIYEITFSATDVSGNTASEITTVIVIDTTAPTVIVRNITKELSASGTVELTAAEVDSATADAAGIASIDINTTEFSCADIGTNTITFTATDNSGNTTSATALVTIIDNTLPIVLTQDFTLTLATINDTAYIQSSDINNGSYDNCGIASIVVTPNIFTIANTGSNSVTLTIKDNNGNTNTAIATVTVIAPTIIVTSQPSISFTSLNTVSWNNIPAMVNSQSGTITSSTSFTTPVGTISSTNGNLNLNGNNGMGVKGGSPNGSCSSNANFLDSTINKNQSVSFVLANNTIGITKVVFATGISAKVSVIGKRNGQTVVAFSKYMTANVLDSFNFSTACLLRGICTVDEVEFKLSSRTSNCVRNWNFYSTTNNTDFEDGVNTTNNCAFTLKNATFFVTPKDICKIGDVSFSSNSNASPGQVVAVSKTLSVSNSTVHSLGSNSDGNFSTGNPASSNPVNRIVVGKNWFGFPSAWEVNQNCSVKNIRQGMFSNSELLPVGNLSNLLIFDYTVTAVDDNGQFIYGKRKNKSTNLIVDIRWKVSEFNQRVWVSNPTVYSFSKRGIEDENQEDVTELVNQPQAFGDLTTSVYPNPSNSQFTFNVSSEESTPVSIAITDMAGRLIYQDDNLVANQDFVVGNELMAGVYIAQVKQGNSIKLLKITKVN